MDEALERAARTRDPRFDGWFVTGVRSTKIYCRPSCPALPAATSNLTLFPTAAAAQLRGYRACKRCRPDAAPGSPAWNLRSDVVARAVRLIADGVVDRDGVTGLARRLGYSERHLHRLLTAELGAGPLALAASQRAATARLLIESTELPFSEVAFAAGFGSVRQFNDTVRAVFATTPTELRRARRAGLAPCGAGTILLRLPVRQPFDATGTLAFLAHRAVPGLEQADEGGFVRSLDLPGGPAVVALRPAGDLIHAELRLTELADLTSAVARCRRLLDLDADPDAVAGVLGADPVLAPLVKANPGRRSPASVDPHEQAVRAVLSQQVSVAAARTITAKLVSTYGTPLAPPLLGPQPGAPTHTFPALDTLAGGDLDLPVPAARRRTVTTLAAAVANGEVCLDLGADRRETLAQLLRLPGIGQWTAHYISMRALADPDVFLATDLGVRHALSRCGLPARPATIERRARAWAPWRSYALHHLWQLSASPGPQEPR